MEFSKTLYKQDSTNQKFPQEISFWMDEIQKLTKENNQLKEDNCAKDFDYVTIIEQLDGKEGEIEGLRAELTQLSEQIALSNAKEEDYLNSARSCVSLENQIQTLQEELAHHRDFEQLSTVHAACPTPEELVSAVEETRASYRKQITEVKDQLSERDKQIMALEDHIARKDVELQKLSSELIQSRLDCNVKQQHCGNLERRITEMEQLIHDRERLIGNMKILMTRKSVKINLLLLKIRELEIKLQMCMKELRAAKETKSSTPGFSHKDIKGPECLRKAWSQGTMNESRQEGFSCVQHSSGGGDGAREAMGVWQELSAIHNSLPKATDTTPGEVDGLLCKLNAIKTKILGKLDQDIMREAEITDLINSTRRHFFQTQIEIEKMRTHLDDGDESRELIRDYVARGMRLNQALESSENEKLAVSVRIQSFCKALKNLEVLEDFLRKPRIT